jgi:drug/metabolite transporter (DMT)-like permease
MAGGYVPFLFLSKTGDISFIAPIMTLHTLFPTVYGFCTGEAVTTTKVLGIIGSFVAVGVLGADSMTGEGPGSLETLLVQLLLLLCSTACWGCAEIIAVKYGRLVRQKHAVLSQLVGTGLVAAVSCGALVFHALSGTPAQIAPPLPPDVGGLLAGISALWLSVVVLAGHAVAGLGWLLYVRLGQLGDASQFAPVVQLYGLVSAVLGILLAGEQVSLFKVVGMLVSGLAIGLLGMSQSQKRSLMRRLGCGSCVPQQTPTRTPGIAPRETHRAPVEEAIRHFQGATAPATYTALATSPAADRQDPAGNVHGDYSASAAGASDPGRLLIMASSAGSTTELGDLTSSVAHGSLHLVSSAGSLTGGLLFRHSRGQQHAEPTRGYAPARFHQVEPHEPTGRAAAAAGGRESTPDTTQGWDSKAAASHDTSAPSSANLLAASSGDPRQRSANARKCDDDAGPHVSDAQENQAALQPLELSSKSDKEAEFGVAGPAMGVFAGDTHARDRACSVASEPLPENTQMQTDLAPAGTSHLTAAAEAAAVALPVCSAAAKLAGPGLLGNPSQPSPAALTPACVFPALPPCEAERAASVGAPEGLAERQESHPAVEALEGAVPGDLDELRGGVAVLGGAAAVTASGAGGGVGAQAPIPGVGGPSDVPRVVSETGTERASPAGCCLIPQGPFAAHTEFIAANDVSCPTSA